MSSPDLPQLFFSNRFCPNLSAIVVSEILMGTEELQLPCAKLFYPFFFFKASFSQMSKSYCGEEAFGDVMGWRGEAENKEEEEAECGV